MRHHSSVYRKWRISFFSSFNVSKETLSRVIILACSTSYYAGLVAKYWFEKYFLIETHVEIALNLDIDLHFLDRKALYIFFSQSGETIDTLAFIFGERL